MAAGQRPTAYPSISGGRGKQWYWEPEGGGRNGVQHACTCQHALQRVVLCGHVMCTLLNADSPPSHPNSKSSVVLPLQPPACWYVHAFNAAAVTFQTTAACRACVCAKRFLLFLVCATCRDPHGAMHDSTAVPRLKQVQQPGPRHLELCGVWEPVPAHPVWQCNMHGRGVWRQLRRRQSAVRQHLRGHKHQRQRVRHVRQPLPQALKQPGHLPSWHVRLCLQSRRRA